MAAPSECRWCVYGHWSVIKRIRVFVGFTRANTTPSNSAALNSLSQVMGISAFINGIVDRVYNVYIIFTSFSQSMLLCFAFIRFSFIYLYNLLCVHPCETKNIIYIYKLEWNTRHSWNRYSAVPSRQKRSIFIQNIYLFNARSYPPQSTVSQAGRFSATLSAVSINKNGGRPTIWQQTQMTKWLNLLPPIYTTI